MAEHSGQLNTSAPQIPAVQQIQNERHSELDDEYWWARHNELCKYDVECDLLKGTSGDDPSTFGKPDQKVLQIIKAYSREILSASQLYSVDPRAMAGAILAENSLNTGIKDEIELFLVKKKILSRGTLLGYHFSYGLGQLKVDRIYDAVEPLAAKIEGRPQKNIKEIAQAITNPKESILYIAAVLRHAQDIYAKYGFEISHQPEILDTLYNTGNVETHAQKTQTEKRMPKVNWFGLFVERYLPTIESTLAVK